MENKLYLEYPHFNYLVQMYQSVNGSLTEMVNAEYIAQLMNISKPVMDRHILVLKRDGYIYVENWDEVYLSVKGIEKAMMLI